MKIAKKYNSFIGIDVSKDKIDAFISITGEFIQVQNTQQALKKWIKTLSPLEDLLVVIDLTGGYEQVCVDTFFNAGFNVHRAEGRRVKNFINATGQYAKTDKIDCEALAYYADTLQDVLRLYQGGQNKIKPLIMRLDVLKEMLRVELNHLSAPTVDKTLKKVIQKHIDYIKKEVLFLEDEVLCIIEQDKELKDKYDFLITQMAIGKKTAFLLIAMMPELGQLNRREVAALSGVAPYVNDSGTLSKHRYTRSGRPCIKRGIFICAMVCVRYDEELKMFFNMLIKKGKPKKIALTAVMRKFIVRLNAKMREEFYA